MLRNFVRSRKLVGFSPPPPRLLVTTLARDKQLYSKKFMKALKVEYAAEQAQTESELRTLSMKDLETLGLAHAGLHATVVENSMTHTIIQVRLRDSCEFQLSKDTRLLPGAEVVLSQKGPFGSIDNGRRFAGKIIGVSERCIHISLPLGVSKASRKFSDRIDWKLYYLRNPTSSDRKTDAVESFLKSYTGPPQLRKLVCHAFGSSQRDCTSDPFTLYQTALGHGDGVLENIAPNALDTLNKEQQQAVLKVLDGSSRIGMIQGPPGTGKTLVASHVIDQFLLMVKDGGIDTCEDDWRYEAGEDDEDDFNSQNSWRDEEESWHHKHMNGKVLVVAPSNVAVDNLMETLANLSACNDGSPHRMVRIGQPIRVSSEMQPFTADKLIERHPNYNKLTALHQQMENALDEQATSLSSSNNMRRRGSKAEEATSNWSLHGNHAENMAKEARQLERKASKLRSRLLHDVLRETDVVFATCVAAGSGLLRSHEFGLVVIDEASQVTEPEMLIPLLKLPWNGRLVMVGDHCQLPPTVISAMASVGASDGAATSSILTTSLFERLARFLQAAPGEHKESRSVATAFLPRQYRMHPAISSWPNERFYSGLLQNGCLPRDRPPILGLNWPNIEYPVAFINVNPPPLPNGVDANGDAATSTEEAAASFSGSGEVQTHQFSFQNKTEAEIAASIVATALSRDSKLKASDLAIITPYAAQTKLIREELARRRDGPSNIDDEEVEVSTVDGFQGREKELIIFSSVRANHQHELGFCGDWRRINVALTRARRGLVIVGHAATLETSPDWKSWLDHVRLHNGEVDQASSREGLMSPAFSF